MSGNFLLDTNIVIAILAKDTGAHHKLAEATAVFVPSIVLGELYYGARKSSRVESMSHMHFQERGSCFSLGLLPQRNGKTKPSRAVRVRRVRPCVGILSEAMCVVCPTRAPHKDDSVIEARRRR